MRGRSKIFEEEDVIQKATQVFWTKGYESASTEDLLQAMGIGKGSFYNTFSGGKEELFEKAMDHFSSLAILTLKERIEQGTDPLGAIKDFFRNIARESKESHLKGCFFANTVTELSGVNDALKNKAVRRLNILEQLFFRALRSAKEKGQLKTKEDPKVLAGYLITLWNGLGVTRRMYPNAKVLGPIIEMHLKILR